jgi:death on curing protein
VDTKFLTFEQVIFIHNDQIDKYGGSHGIHDLPLLESAIMRPQTTFGGEDLYPTLFDKCAAMIHSLIMNHAFVEGNKRTAMVSGILFLELNGYILEAEHDEIIEAALKVRHKKWGLEKFAKWLREHSKKV